MRESALSDNPESSDADCEKMAKKTDIAASAFEQ